MVLGGLGALLGRSWGGLGRSCGDLKATLGEVNFLIILLIDFGGEKGAKRVPKGRPLGSQNGTKIDPKTWSKFKREKVASWDRLGSILSRFGGAPGGHFY